MRDNAAQFTSQFFRNLDRCKLLSGRLKRRIQEKNPMMYDYWLGEIATGYHFHLEKYPPELVLKGPARLVAEYAITVMRDRWPEAEEKIFENPIWTVYYYESLMNSNLGHDAPDIETIKKVAIQLPSAAVIFARTILRGVWPEAEPIIATQQSTATEYCMCILRKYDTRYMDNWRKEKLGEDRYNEIVFEENQE